ncbi:MAG: tetratricopeptide repeat protein [Deltaproteobacteria bacterium]|nr:tetratricopeptide repeat protein [Deltaproteobacteria bacterium]
MKRSVIYVGILLALVSMSLRVVGRVHASHKHHHHEQKNAEETEYEKYAARTESKYDQTTPTPEPTNEPKTPRDFFELAVKAFRVGDSRNAEIYCQQAINRDKHYADAHYLLGQVYLFRAAEKNRLEIKNSGFESAQNKYVKQYLKGIDELELAKKQFQIVIQLQPKAVDAYLNLGVATDNLGEEEEAKKAYLKAIELKPYSTTARDAHNNLGLIYQTDGDVEKAAEQYREALRIDATFSASRVNLNRLLEKYPKLKKDEDK